MERPIHYNEQIYEVTLKWWQWCEEDRRDVYLLLKRNTFYEEALPCAIPPLSVFGEAWFGNIKGSKPSFKKYQFSMNNAKITRTKEKAGMGQEMDSWDIEKIIWLVIITSNANAQTFYRIKKSLAKRKSRKT